jgi:hypothetical protein
LDGAPGEIRTPDRSVRSPAGEPISYLISTTCGLDQPQNIVISSVNEPYLVLYWYIIATYASQQAKPAKADARELAVSGRNVPILLKNSIIWVRDFSGEIQTTLNLTYK